MNPEDDMLDEYDFSNGVRGKYAQAYREGINIIQLDRDVTPYFPDAQSVNEALRTFIRIMHPNTKSSTLPTQGAGAS